MTTYAFININRLDESLFFSLSSAEGFIDNLQIYFATYSEGDGCSEVC